MRKQKLALLWASRTPLGLLILAIVLLVAGCSSSEPTATPQPTSTPTLQPIELVILHTNDVLGYTEPCG